MRYRADGARQRELERQLGPVTLVAAPIPWDCLDGFYGAFWRRPAEYLDPAVRAGVPVFARLARAHVEDAAQALGTDLRSGAWHQRHLDLPQLVELHLGYYVVIAELS